jgi:cell division protein FtsW
MRKTPTALIGAILILLSIGIVMLDSSSSVKAAAAFNDAHYFVKRQALWLAVGLVAAFLVSLVDYHRWRQFAVPVFLVAVVLLVLVLVPGIGVRVKGSNRWIDLGLLRFQPSEFAKLAAVVGLAWWLDRVQSRVGTLKNGLLIPGAALAVPLGLILTEPDFGTTVLVAAVSGVLLFVSGAKVRHLLVCALLGVCVLALAVLHDPVRMKRIRSLVDPAYQLVQSEDAFIMGGPLGVGLGQSLQKYHYLPEAHTDFILPIIGEELGLPATGLIVGCFAAVLICGLWISHRAPDLFGRLLGLGITVTFTLQAVINIGVVTGCLPPKGIPLPFISYGGSSLLMSLIAVGVLLNVARHATVGFGDEHTASIRDRLHRL